MLQKNTNSRIVETKKQKDNEGKMGSNNSNEQSQYGDDNGLDNEDQLEDFYSDEEPENFESQKEDMKMYLNKLNKRIDLLVEALKSADGMMAKMGDQKGVIEQINNKKGKKRNIIHGQAGPNGERKSIAEFFKEQISRGK